MWRAWLDNNFILTKRHLGILLLAAGLALLIAAGMAEVLRTGPAGIGTVQKMVIGTGILSTLVGITLLPLHDQPA